MTFDPLAPELPPQNDAEQLIEDGASLDEIAVALLEAHLGMPGREEAAGGFAPEIREFDGTAAVLAFTHPGRLDRWLSVAERPEGRLVAHAAPGRALFEQLVAGNLPLALNPANVNARVLPVAVMQVALGV